MVTLAGAECVGFRLPRIGTSSQRPTVDRCFGVRGAEGTLPGRSPDAGGR